ncbi:MAG: hypothetical protein ACK5GN_12565 [Pseudomonadota bacterium]|jgi:hypothetical protein
MFAGKKRQPPHSGAHQPTPEEFLCYIVLKHKDELREALRSGVVSEDIKSALKQLKLGTTDILPLINSEEIRCALATSLELPLLRCGVVKFEKLLSALSLPQGGDIKDSEDVEKLGLACKLLLCTKETLPLAAVIMSQTLSPSEISEQKDLSQLESIVRKLRSCLADDAFDRFQILAAKNILHTFNPSSDDEYIEAYMKAIQLGPGCFGSLEDPETQESAKRLMAHYLPTEIKCRDESNKSRLLPASLWFGFTRQGQERLLMGKDGAERLCSWMKGMLARVKYELVQCREIFERQQDDFIEIDSNLPPMNFDLASRTLTGAVEFFNDALDLNLSRGHLCKISKLAEPLIGVLTDMFCLLSESGAEFALSDQLTNALEEQISHLREQSNAVEKCFEDFIKRSLIPTFRLVVYHGHIASALNLRRLCPLNSTKGEGDSREQIDDFIAKTQSQMIYGLSAACSSFKISGHFGAEQQSFTDQIKRAFLRLVEVDPSQCRSGTEDFKQLAKALGGVVRHLLSYDANQLGKDTFFWGCKEVGEILQRLHKNPNLQQEVLREAVFGKEAEEQKIKDALVACMVRFPTNENSEYIRPVIELLWNVAQSINVALPPLSASKEPIMKAIIDAAIIRWCAGVEKNAKNSASSNQKSDDSKYSRAEVAYYGQEKGEIPLQPGQYADHAQLLLRQADYMLAIPNELEESVFRRVFAELVVGYLFKSDCLGDEVRKKVEQQLDGMLKSNSASLVCQDTELLNRLQQFINIYDGTSIFSLVRKNNCEPADQLTKADVLKLFQSWGLEISKPSA